MSGDRASHTATAIVVVGEATFAAIVSYSHILSRCSARPIRRRLPGARPAPARRRPAPAAPGPLLPARVIRVRKRTLIA
jgi:hypothetical protein